jgi:hypothetical protein
MTKNQVLLGIIIALIVAVALDYGLFVIWGLLYLSQPADFNYHDSNYTFKVIHYQFDWIHYLIEVVFVFGLLTLILNFQKGRKKRGRCKSNKN